MPQNVLERGNRGWWETLGRVRCRERIGERMALQLETDLQNVERGDAEAILISHVSSFLKLVYLPRY